MKNTKITKTDSPFLIDVRDYLSCSMLLKNDQNKQVDTETNLPVNKSVENSMNARHFDLFAHIIEG
jgi:hypothetical protein